MGRDVRGGKAIASAETAMVGEKRRGARLVYIRRKRGFNCTEQLQEDVLDEFILAALVEDLGEEITILAIVHNDVSEIFPFDDTTVRDNAVVSGGKRAETDLA